MPAHQHVIKTLVHGRDDRNGFTRTKLIVPKEREAAVLTPIPIDEQPKGCW